MNQDKIITEEDPDADVGEYQTHGEMPDIFKFKTMEEYEAAVDKYLTDDQVDTKSEAAKSETQGD